MEQRERKAREIHKRISAALLNEWDPINIKDTDCPRDEYDHYAGAVYGLLSRNASPMQIAEHLAKMERENMGYETPPAKLLPVAKKLLELDISLDSEGKGSA